MTKADIVQRLLDKKQITAEEAVVLLSSVGLELEQKHPLWVTNPWFGILPPSTNNPYTITTTTTEGNEK